ncbi:MAG TPA: ATP-binding protein [Bryobacteraceae bacterium]|nr:ATP-binding protein [Bryobacteraceae bacterium]
MLKFRDRPIGQKVTIITMVITTSALVLSGFGLVLADTILYRRGLQRDLSSLAQIVADNSADELASNDRDAATQALNALRIRTHMDAACIYRPSGELFARYARLDGFRCPPPRAGKGVAFGAGELTLAQPIVLRGNRIGTLMLAYDLSGLSARARLYGVTVAFVLLAATLVAFLLSAHLRALISTPVARLVSATNSVSETGDYSVRAQKLSSDELGVLVDRFNAMLAGIQSRDGELKKALADREAALREAEDERQRFHFMAESMPQKIFATAPGGESTYLNKQWMEFTGLSFEQLRDWGWVQIIHPDDLEEGMRAWRHAIATGEPLQMMSRIRRADGVYRWHLNRARAMRNSQGQIALWIGSSTDIHEQKQTEVELRRANEDLQQFAYSASHDLQEPIRNVAIYSEILAKRYQHVLDADGQLYLGFLKEGGRRLATLVNDLLAYTTASRAELSEAAVDAAAAFQNALSSLSEAIRESQAVVTCDPLPEEVHMSEAHLRQVFQNLVGNALKYRDSRPPRVHVAAVGQGAFWRFSVQDNGIGIDPLYKEKVFGVFKRLHHDRKYSGTGIGLAICQRVVERYGGRIWVESEPGKGATFFFTVPQPIGPARGSGPEPAAG